MELHILGTTASIPTKERSSAAVAMRSEGEVYLFDCGEGTQQRLQESELSMMRIKHVFITHFHGDHFNGLSGMLQTMSLWDRTEELHVYGPKDCAKFVKMILKTGYFGLKFKVNAHDIGQGVVYKTDEFKIKAFKTEHNIPSLGYVIEGYPTRHFNKVKADELGVPDGPARGKLKDGKSIRVDGKIIRPEQVLSEPTPGKKIVITGDTICSKKVVKAAKGADILIHEATFSDDEDRAKLTLHSTAAGAARVAKEAGAKMLILYHYSTRYKDAKVLEDKAKETFENSVAAKDLDVFKV